MFRLDNNNKVVVDPEFLLMPKFAAIWDKDKSIVKTSAMNDFAYIYFTCDYRSLFLQQYLESEVPDEVKRQILQNEKYKPTKDVLAACDYYKGMQRTKAHRLLELGEDSLEAVERVLKESLKDTSLGSITDILKLIKLIPDVNKQLRDARIAIEQELTQTGKSGRAVSKWEDGVNVGEDFTGVV